MSVRKGGMQSQSNTGMLKDSFSKGANIGITNDITGTERNSGGLNSLEEFHPDMKFLSLNSYEERDHDL